MLNIRFTKSDSAIYVSHIDILRNLNKTLRRAKIPMRYSQGFNPHTLINLSQPLPLGIASLSEWASLNTEMTDADLLLDKYNANCPLGVKATECYYTDKAMNIAGRVTYSDYFIASEKALALKDKLEGLNKSPYVLSYEAKKGTVEKEVSSLIREISVDEKGIYLMLAFGNVNLRIDKLYQQFNKDFDLDIANTDVVRLSQYVEENGLVAVSDYLRR